MKDAKPEQTGVNDSGTVSGSDRWLTHPDSRPVRETLAMALFAKWSIDGTGFPERNWKEPDWIAYKEGHELNCVGLSKESFLEEADWLQGLIQPHLT